MTDPQVPRIADVMSFAVDALVAGLPDRQKVERERHANWGRYGDVLRGFGGQCEVARALLTKEIIATRLIAANGGQALRDLAASECFAELASEPQYAVGEVYLARRKINASPAATGNFLAGVIPLGTKITRPQSTGDIPLSAADYLVTEPVTCSADDTSPPVDLLDGTWQHDQVVLLQLRAASPGTEANTERVNVLASNPRGLFDAALTAAERFQGGTIYSAGGAVEVSDGQLLDFAKSMGPGFYAANTSAAHAGARTDPRVRRVASSLDYKTAVLRLYVADQSWATSVAYRNSVLQGINDRKWVGFGARLAVGQIYNVAVSVAATVYTRSKLYDADKSAITEAVREKLTGYFDNRSDFYTWNLNAIGGVIAKAHPRVLTAAAPVVTSSGIALTQPANQIADGAETIPHYSLRSLELTYAEPGS